MFGDWDDNQEAIAIARLGDLSTVRFCFMERVLRVFPVLIRLSDPTNLFAWKNVKS